MSASRDSAPIKVTVAYAAPGVEALVVVQLPVGSIVDAAVARSGFVERLALDPARLDFAIFGQRAGGDTPLVDGDRVEITRPLAADPKQTRRQRATKRVIRRSTAN